MVTSQQGTRHLTAGGGGAHLVVGNQHLAMDVDHESPALVRRSVLAGGGRPLLPAFGNVNGTPGTAHGTLRSASEGGLTSVS